MVTYPKELVKCEKFKKRVKIPKELAVKNTEVLELIRYKFLKPKDFDAGSINL